MQDCIGGSEAERLENDVGCFLLRTFGAYVKNAANCNDPLQDCMINLKKRRVIHREI